MCLVRVSDITEALRRLQSVHTDTVERLDGIADGHYNAHFLGRSHQTFGTVFVLDTGLRCVFCSRPFCVRFFGFWC